MLHLSRGTISSIRNFLGFYGLKIKGLLKLTLFVSILSRLGLFNSKHFVSGLFKASACRLGRLNKALWRLCRSHRVRVLVPLVHLTGHSFAHLEITDQFFAVLVGFLLL